MGHKHSRDEILAGAVEAARADGLSQLTFGRLAKRLGISDRIVVYYFPTKDQLLTEVMLAVGSQLQETLAAAFTTPATDHVQLARAAWPVVSRPEADPVFALFFEANGLAASAREPYRTLVTQLVDAWIDWLTTFVDGPPELRRREAEGALALIDGLLLLRHVAGPDAADRAAEILGVGSSVDVGPGRSGRV